MAKKKNILVTGLPGSGKTTLLCKAAEALRPFHPAGFITSEIREAGVRQGFELRSLNGRQGLLAHVDIVSPYRVGKYKVDVAGFESFLNALSLRESPAGLVIIDEIGKMECLSGLFQDLMGQILDSDKIVLASIALKGGGFINRIRTRQDVRLFELDEDRRHSLTEEIVGEIRDLSAQGRTEAVV